MRVGMLHKSCISPVLSCGLYSIVTSEWDSSKIICKCKCKVHVLIVLSFVLGVGHCLS